MADRVESEGKLKKKPKNGLEMLGEIYPGCSYSLVGQYGAADQSQMIYVMEIEIESQMFQGIGNSKRKAKIMAAEYALIYLGKLDKLTDDPENLKEDPYCWNDFTSDIIDNSTTLFCDFSKVSQEATIDEDDMDEWIEALTYDGDERRHMIGRNSLSILSELHPESSYRLISAVVDKHRLFFVMSVQVNDTEFKGSAPSKKLARARAAREALKTMYKIDFGVLEDGMPVYEGDEQIWKMYKKKLEDQALKADYYNPITNPVKQLNEFYPDMKITFPHVGNQAVSPDTVTAQTCIDGEIYESSGTSKKLAKTNLARHVISVLKENGMYDSKVEELNERKRLKDKKYNEKPKLFDGTRSAVSKLNDLRPELEYTVVAETPLKNTCIIAFTVAVHVDDKTYVGVGKNKKTAKLEAAEKALKDLGLWDEEDEEAKMKSKIELNESDVMQDGNQPQLTLNASNDKKKPLDLMEMAKHNMSRQDVMNLVKDQLGLNINYNLERDFRNSKRKRNDSRSDIDDVLDEIDALVENILASRTGGGEYFKDFQNDHGGNRYYQNKRNANYQNSREFGGNNNYNRGYNNQQRFQPNSQGYSNWNAPPPLIPPELFNRSKINHNQNNNMNNNYNNNMGNNYNNNMNNNNMRSSYNNVNNNYHQSINNNNDNYNNNNNYNNFNYNQNTWVDLTKPMKWSGAPSSNNTNTGNFNSGTSANTHPCTNIASSHINTGAAASISKNIDTNASANTTPAVNKSTNSTVAATPATQNPKPYTNYDAANTYNANYNYPANPYGTYPPYWNNGYNQSPWDPSSFMYPQYPQNVNTSDPSYYTGQHGNGSSYDWNSAWNSAWNSYYTNPAANNTTNNANSVDQFKK